MSYLETLTNEIKNLNQVRPNHLDGLIWNERVKGCFQGKSELKKLIADAIKNEYLLFQCNSCRNYFRYSSILTTFIDELDNHMTIRCKPCQRLFKQAKLRSEALENDSLVNIGAIRR